MDGELPDRGRVICCVADQGVISRDLCKRLEAMVGFRNVAVHDYEAIDIAILKSIVADRLGDLDALMEAVRRHVS